MIELKEVTKKYFNKIALEGVTLALPVGRIVGIVGENGSGKSTILKLLAGLVRPSLGTVIIDDEPITRQSCKKVAYLSELDTYYDFYNVQETIEFFASQFADFDLNKANEIRDYMKLEPNQKVKNLSKGQRGRLKIVLTLARKVPVVLMDEPLSGLDPMVRESVVKSLISFMDIEKQTLIITTHEVSEIEPLLDMVIALHQGKVIKVAEVEELRLKEGQSIVDWMKRIYE